MSRVTCKVKKPKKRVAKKIKVKCNVKVAKAATARLTHRGRTVAVRRVKAGARTLVFRVRGGSRGTFRLRMD